MGKLLKVSGGIVKEEVIVADISSAAKITLWEKDVGCLTEGKSY